MQRAIISTAFQNTQKKTKSKPKRLALERLHHLMHFGGRIVLPGLAVALDIYIIIITSSQHPQRDALAFAAAQYATPSTQPHTHKRVPCM